MINISMAVISFPQDPEINDTYEFNNNIYRWDGSRWRLVPRAINSETTVRLETPREINGTFFDGTADIVTESWGSARNLTIGTVTRLVDGSDNYEWSLSDLGLDSISIEKTLTLTNSWQDTGISGNSLETGTYAIQLFANDIAEGGFNDNEYYAGVLSWFSGETNESPEMPIDEIVLHRAGGGSDASIFLRTVRTNVLKLQIFSILENINSSQYIFRFKKLI